MKRVVSLMLVVLMIAAIFVGCGSSGSSGDATGTYKIKTVNGKSIKDYFKESMGVTSDSDLELALSFFGVDSLENLITFDLRSGGKLVVSMMGEEAEGTWKQEGSKVTMTVEGEDQTATFSGNELTVNMDGEKMVLAR